jgi:hypothetical protein
VNDEVLAEVVDGAHEPVLEFLPGAGVDVAQHGTRELAKEALNEVEP